MSTIDSNRTNAAIVIGIVDPNGTQFYSNGKMSKANYSTVNQNTIFAIGSNTKVFTTILLGDMVQDGLIKLNDPIDKYLPSNVKVPQYNVHKITIEDSPILPDYRNFLLTIVQVSQKQIHRPLMKKFNS